MKKIITGSIATLFFLLFAKFSTAQCGAGYTLASLNWDLQYNNGGFTIGSTGTRFGFGINSLLITSSGDVTSTAPDAAHTGNAGIAVTGAADPTANNDAKYTIGNGTITFTFYNELQNVSFTLFDIDNGQVVTVTADNAANSAQNVNLTALGSTTLTLSGNNTASASATGASGGNGSASNNSAVTVNVSGTVKTITLTFTKASGTDAIWLSDITACTNGTFASNYYTNAAPEASQVEYFLVARSNNINIVNASTGAASLMYTDASLASTGINSLAYDNANQIVYYTSEEYVSTNKTIYKYNVKTGTESVFISDVTASPYNISLSNYGLGSGAATFYNGSLFIGFEASTENLTGGLYRIDLDASLNPTIASRVMVKKGADINGQMFGYGDFVADDAVLYLTDNASSNGLQIYNLNTMTLDNTYTTYKGQMSISSNGTPRFVDNTPSFGNYNGSGNWGTATTITNTTGSITNDASEVFKYPSDYGDAPSSYGTAYHQFAIPSVLNNRLGASIDYELVTFNTSSSNGDDIANGGSSDDEDAISTLSSFNTSNTTYSATVSVYNVFGSAISLYGWIDFNRNGTFDVGERAGSSGNVANNATSVTLTWTGISGVVAGQSYLRIRIGTINAEVNTPTGLATNGEAEDYSLMIKVAISGTVFNDNDGMIDASVDGTGIATPSTTQLYAYLVNSGGLVSQKVNLPANGIYSFSDLDPSTTYSVRISSTNVNVGASAPLTAALPTGWVSTGENYGTSNEAGSGNESGTANSQITVTTGTGNISGVNFGIEKLSSAHSKTYSGLNSTSFNTASGNANFTGKIALNAVSGTTDAAVNSNSGSILPGKLSGTDFEDGLYGGATGSSGTRTLVLTALPNYTYDVLVYNNGTSNILLVPNPTINDASYTYWNTATARYEIPSFNANNLSVFFKPGTHSSFNFSYAYKDAAGLLGNAATYTVSATSALPMKLLYFGAEIINNEVTIKFITTNEFNIETYRIERSIDMQNWSTVKDKMPNNSYATISTYLTYDALIQAEVVYYRLKEIDTDGSIFYSSIVSVSNEDRSMDVKVFPNPAKNNEVLNIEIANKNHENVSYKMMDLNGKTIFENTVNPEGNHIPVELNNIPSGIYLLSVSNSNVSKTTKVVIK
jgi:hypothetical protein